jgi:hypothetical protein
MNSEAINVVNGVGEDRRSVGELVCVVVVLGHRIWGVWRNSWESAGMEEGLQFWIGVGKCWEHERIKIWMLGLREELKEVWCVGRLGIGWCW